MGSSITLRLADAEREALECVVARWNEEQVARGFTGVETVSSVIRKLVSREAARLEDTQEPVDLAAVRDRKALNEAGKSDLPRPELIEETVKLLKDQSEKPPLRLVEPPASVPADEHGPPALPPWVGAARGENESGDEDGDGDEPVEADPDLSDKDLDELLNGMGDD